MLEKGNDAAMEAHSSLLRIGKLVYSGKHKHDERQQEPKEGLAYLPSPTVIVDAVDEVISQCHLVPSKNFQSTVSIKMQNTNQMYHRLRSDEMVVPYRNSSQSSAASIDQSKSRETPSQDSSIGTEGSRQRSGDDRERRSPSWSVSKEGVRDSSSLSPDSLAINRSNDESDSSSENHPNQDMKLYEAKEEADVVGQIGYTGKVFCFDKNRDIWASACPRPDDAATKSTEMLPEDGLVFTGKEDELIRDQWKQSVATAKQKKFRVISPARVRFQQKGKRIINRLSTNDEPDDVEEQEAFNPILKTSFSSDDYVDFTSTTWPTQAESQPQPQQDHELPVISSSLSWTHSNQQQTSKSRPTTTTMTRYQPMTLHPRRLASCVAPISCKRPEIVLPYPRILSPNSGRQKTTMVPCQKPDTDKLDAESKSVVKGTIAEENDSIDEHDANQVNDAKSDGEDQGEEQKQGKVEQYHDEATSVSGMTRQTMLPTAKLTESSTVASSSTSPSRRVTSPVSSIYKKPKDRLGRIDAAILKTKSLERLRRFATVDDEEFLQEYLSDRAQKRRADHLQKIQEQQEKEERDKQNKSKERKASKISISPWQQLHDRGRDTGASILQRLGSNERSNATTTNSGVLSEFPNMSVFDPTATANNNHDDGNSKLRACGAEILIPSKDEFEDGEETSDDGEDEKDPRTVHLGRHLYQQRIFGFRDGSSHQASQLQQPDSGGRSSCSYTGSSGVSMRVSSVSDVDPNTSNTQRHTRTTKRMCIPNRLYQMRSRRFNEKTNHQQEESTDKSSSSRLSNVSSFTNSNADDAEYSSTAIAMASKSESFPHLIEIKAPAHCRQHPDDGDDEISLTSNGSTNSGGSSASGSQHFFRRKRNGHDIGRRRHRHPEDANHGKGTNNRRSRPTALHGPFWNNFLNSCKNGETHVCCDASSSNPDVTFLSSWCSTSPTATINQPNTTPAAQEHSPLSKRWWNRLAVEVTATLTNGGACGHSKTTKDRQMSSTNRSAAEEEEPYPPPKGMRRGDGGSSVSSSSGCQNAVVRRRQEEERARLEQVQLYREFFMKKQMRRKNGDEEK